MPAIELHVYLVEMLSPVPHAPAYGDLMPADVASEHGLNLFTTSAQFCDNVEATPLGSAWCGQRLKSFPTEEGETMKLYWAPHTCAIGIHILLEEAGMSYEIERLDVVGGETQQPAFLAINPKGKVPTLVRDDGSVLTEFGAIPTWIARRNPAAELIPSNPDAEARMIEVLEYVEGTIHGQGFGRIFKPSIYEPQDVLHTTMGLGQAAVKEQGKEMVEKAFAIMNEQISCRLFAAGDSFSIADPALFYVERWAPQHGITLPANLGRHYQAMLARPTVQKVRAIWGES